MEGPLELTVRLLSEDEERWFSKSRKPGFNYNTFGSGSWIRTRALSNSRGLTQVLKQLINRLEGFHSARLDVFVGLMFRLLPFFGPEVSLAFIDQFLWHENGPPQWPGQRIASHSYAAVGRQTPMHNVCISKIVAVSGRRGIPHF